MRLDCDGGWVHSSRPWVLHSRQRWQEWVSGWVRGWGWGVQKDQILGTFLLIGWLSKSSWLSHKAGLGMRGNDPPSSPSTVQDGQDYKLISLRCSVSLHTVCSQSVRQSISTIVTTERGPSLYMFCIQTLGQCKVSLFCCLFFLCFFVVVFLQSRHFCPLQFSSVPEQQWTS